MEKIGPNIYAETKLRGCNPGFVVTEEGIVMIDTPQAPTAALKWREFMQSRGEIRYLINTEDHRDHVTGNFFFSATGIAHQKVREAIAALEVNPILERIKAIDPEGYPLMEGYYIKKPSITFSERLTLHLGKLTFEVIHLPGHTAGQSAVYIPQERVVFTGDNVFHRVQTYLHEAYPEDWLKSLRKIGELDVDTIIPGHGEICDKSYLQEQATFIEEWMEAVRLAIQRGLSKKEAQEKISFLDRYPMDVGLAATGPEVMRMNVGRLYDLLSKR
jgi:cyclase